MDPDSSLDSEDSLQRGVTSHKRVWWRWNRYALHRLCLGGYLCHTRPKRDRNPPPPLLSFEKCGLGQDAMVWLTPPIPPTSIQKKSNIDLERSGQLCALLPFGFSLSVFSRLQRFQPFVWACLGGTCIRGWPFKGPGEQQTLNRLSRTNHSSLCGTL